jgi:hypothetical protein
MGKAAALPYLFFRHAQNSTLRSIFEKLRA